MALVNGTEQFYTIYFYDESGNYTRLNASATPNIVVEAPVMTSLVAGDFKMTLSWDKVMVATADVDSYEIKYGYSADELIYTKTVLLTDVGFDPENPSVEITENVNNYSTYWVTVTAKYSGVESVQASPVLSATPTVVDLVPQPQNVFAVAGDAAFRVKWDDNAVVDKWLIRYGTSPENLTTLVEVLPVDVQIDVGDSMAFFDILHAAGVTPVVNDTLYFVRMWAEITGSPELSRGSEIVGVYPQAGLVGFVDGLYSYSVPYYENIVGIPLLDASMATLADMTTTMQSPYTILYDTSFKTYIPGISQGGDAEILGATAYVVGASDKAGEDIIVTGDEWSNDITSL